MSPRGQWEGTGGFASGGCCARFRFCEDAASDGCVRRGLAHKQEREQGHQAGGAHPVSPQRVGYSGAPGGVTTRGGEMKPEMLLLSRHRGVVVIPLPLPR